jgi:arsenate reductase
MSTPAAPVRVLILCTHNAARSQMAEALLRQLGGARFDVQSAGTEATRVHPLAIRALAEIGIDSSFARSKHLREFLGQRFDYVITVCDQASEACPVFPSAPRRIHWSVPDPCAVEGSEEERLRVFEQVRDELAQRLRAWARQLPAEQRPAGASTP